MNFVVGITFIFVVGLILYATLALLTPYLQTLMDYPVVTAGVVLAPRGIGTMVAMMVCGWLVGKRVNTRLLVAIGFLATAYALYDMMSWTPDISEWTIVDAGFIQGVSIGFVFVPLSTVTFATLPAELRTQATGVFSLVRNLGSAIGISVTGALLVSNTQVNHAQIADGVTPFNRTLERRGRALLGPGQLHGAATAERRDHPPGQRHRLYRRLQADADPGALFAAACAADPAGAQAHCRQSVTPR